MCLRATVQLNIGQSLFDECEEVTECDDCMPHNSRRGEDCQDMLYAIVLPCNRAAVLPLFAISFCFQTPLKFSEEPTFIY